MAKPRISAVIMDLDGTLLDTERATRDVLKDFLVTYGKVADAEKEERRLGQMHRESATGIIADYGLPLTVQQYSEAIFPLYMQRWPKAKVLPGVNRLIKHLHENGVPVALASNSIRRNIYLKTAKQKDWKDCFSVVLGGDDVPHGKPSPDIFLEAAKRLGVDPSSCLVIEDSMVGVQAARAAGAKVVAVPSLQSQRHRYSIADVVLYSLLDFQPELWGLPPFEDRIQGALPIEPMLLRGQIGDVVSNNLYSVTTDDGSYEYIPDQVSGIFFGWGKLETHGISKAAVSIGWDFSSKTPQRLMRARIIDSSDKIERGSLEIILIGYIRKLQTEESLCQALAITDEDKSIASNSLDLPAFSEHASSLHLTREALLGFDITKQEHD